MYRPTMVVAAAFVAVARDSKDRWKEMGRVRIAGPEDLHLETDRPYAEEDWNFRRVSSDSEEQWSGS